MILAGDIGGTKTNLALYTLESGVVTEYAKRQYASRDFAALEAVIDQFEAEVGSLSVEAACFGVAGPVVDGKSRITNLPWEITTVSLQNRLQTQKVGLLNDLEATAYGMLYLDETAFVDLNPAGVAQRGNRAVIAAGTGLGEGMLYFDGAAFHPIASEGGHSDFAPLTPQQDGLLMWLRQRYPEHVSYERILSGPGVYALYEYLAASGFAPEPEMMQQLGPDVDKSAMVSRCALEHGDPLCLEALRLFTEIYGAEAGNLALKAMAVGGLYIGGGIAPKLLSVLREGYFLKSFVAKGRFETMLTTLPVKVALEPETALIGAAHYAVDRLA